MTETPSGPSRLYQGLTILVEVGWLAAIVLVPLVVNPWGLSHELPRVALLRALTLLMLAAHLCACAVKGTDIGHWLGRPLVRPILLLAGAVLLSTLASLSPLLSLRGTYYRQQGAYLALCFVLWALLIAAYLRTPAHRRRLITAVVVAGSLVALTPLVEALIQGENPLTGRPGGSLGNPIFLGAYLIMVLPFTLAYSISYFVFRISYFGTPSAQCPGRDRLSRDRLLRVCGCGLALAMQLFALLITQSRGPWVGALAGLTVYAALTFWHGHRWLVLVGLVAVFLLIGGLVAGLNFGLVPSARLSQLPYVRRVVVPQGLSGGTMRVRLVLWRAAGKVVTAWPEVGLSPDRLRLLRPVVGYGPDTAAIVYTAAYPPELAHIEDRDAIWDRAHNETLDLLSMQGWLGVAATLVLGVACARRGLALWQAASDPAERAWVAAPLAALVGHVVEVQFAFCLTATGMMAWLCLAWLASEGGSLRELGVSHQAKRGSYHQELPCCQDDSQPWQGWRSLVRWRIYAAAGALLLLVLVVARLEGAVLWADALVARARTLDGAGQWKESIALYDRALTLVPWQAAYHQFRAEAFYNLARALPEDQAILKAGLFDGADRSLARALLLEPLEVEYYANGGVLHAYWSEAVDPSHLETAIAFYQQAFRLAPTRAELRTDLGHVYHNHGRYEEALAQYRVALAIDPQLAAAQYDSGLAWLEIGRRDLAGDAFRAALALAPDCAACQDALQALRE